MVRPSITMSRCATFVHVTERWKSYITAINGREEVDFGEHEMQKYVIRCWRQSMLFLGSKITYETLLASG